METIKNEASPSSGSNILKIASGFNSGWIKATAQLAKDAVSFPTKIRTGDNFTLAGSTSVSSSFDTDNVPGICVIMNSLFPGISKDPSSPISLASRGIWAAIRNYITSVYKNYSNTAVIKYLIGMMAIFQYYVVEARAYGAIRYANYINRYAGREMLQAMGFNAVDLTNNAFKLRNHINMIVSKCKNLVIPKGFAEFDKSMFTYRDIYADQKDDRAQWYMFMPAFLWKMNRNTVSGQWELIPSPLPTNATVDDLIAYGWDLMNAVLDDEDVGIIGGDLVKAFKGQLWQLSEVDENYYIGVKYSEEMLDKIHNACVLDINPTNSVIKGLDITSKVTDNGDPYIYFNPYFEVSSSTPTATNLRRMCGTRVVDFESDPTEDRKLIAMLNMFALREEVEDNVSRFYFDTVGSEVIWYIKIWYYDRSGALVCASDPTRTYISSATSSTVTITKNDLLVIKLASKFRHYPIRTIISNVTNDPGYAGIIGDMQYYTKLDHEQLQYYHQQCLLGLWNINLQEKFG